MTFILPEPALQQHVAILGKTGSGKTWTAKVIVEHLLQAKRRVGIIDPTSAWYGLRSSSDGKGAGFPVLVLGGDHGDLPLPALGGAAVARLLVEQGVNLVADTSALTVGERTRWFIDFAHTLYRANRAPLHLVIDEAHNFAPQGKVPDPDTGKMLHAANTLASGGRSRGIRLLMITQRPQKLHKDALTSADTLIAMRVLAPHDRLAVEDWIKGCGDMAAGKEVLNSLASLQRGEGWIWYPEGGFLKRTKFPPIQTFDSSATPTDGHAIAAPKGAAEIDLTEIRAAMAEAVKEAEANDPRRLRARIAELERRAPAPADYAQTIVQSERKGYEQGRADTLQSIGQLVSMSEKHASELLANLRAIEASMREARVDRKPPVPQVSDKQSAPRIYLDPKKPLSSAPGEVGNGGLRRILIALAQRPQGLTKRQIGVRAGMSSGSGTFSTYLAKARTSGWIDTDGAGRIVITRGGDTALGTYDPLPTGRDLLNHWLQNLGDSGAARILKAVADRYPHAITKAEAAAEADMSDGSGTFSTYLSKLRTLELIEGRGELRASAELFE